MNFDGRRGHEAFTWTDEHAASFDVVKEAIGNAGMKYHPRAGHTYVLATDANDTYIGGLLGLVPDEDLDKSLQDITSNKSVAFTSWRLSEAEQKFSTVEKEALSVITNVRRFKTMIQGSRPFMLYTDAMGVVPSASSGQEHHIKPSTSSITLMA